jgi:hypothetical protein
MKLIIRDYLASLKERGELDAILPDLLSELGFTVYSRPRRGTAQHGVDIAAVGQDEEDGVRKLFLFSVKQGDLTRQDWDGNPQALRASLNAIQDAYLPARVPAKYRHLKIVICVCLGGEIQEQVRSEVTGYFNAHSTDRISFEEWNGDKIAGLLLRGILREEILPKSLRSSFQKSVAMVDEPDVSYEHFTELVNKLREQAGSNEKARITAARQLYVCLWILFVWARATDNVDAPYRASELALLNVWYFLRPFIGKKSKKAQAITRVLHQLMQLHVTIAGELIERRVFPHVGKLDALSMAVETRSAVDINLKLFDLLGRIAMTGLWLHWFSGISGKRKDRATRQQIAQWCANAFKLIESNSALWLPACDQQAIEVALTLLLSVLAQESQDDAASWLHAMVGRLHFTVRTHGRYPCIFTDYHELADHPRERTDEYRREATAGSILIPLLAAWSSAVGDGEALAKLTELQKADLEHCTMQLWLPDKSSEEQLYIGGRDHGIALCDLAFSATGTQLLDTIAEACDREKSFTSLSASQTGYWPIILLACRHYRLPVPPQFWIYWLRPAKGSNNKVAA